jgi:hypothetical protein
LDAKIDHHADPHPNPDVAHSERAGRQEHQGWMIAGRGPPRRGGGYLDGRFRTGREPKTTRV